MPDARQPMVAAILPGETDGYDDLLLQLAADLRQQGWRVRGLVQRRCPEEGSCRLALIDLDQGVVHEITQDLGSGASACALDVQVMADLSGILRRIAREGADLVMVNRFGKLESTGEGFAAEMLALMSQGIPVLTVVQAAYQPAWETFTGGLAQTLPAERAAIEGWCRQALSGVRLIPAD